MILTQQEFIATVASNISQGLIYLHFIDPTNTIVGLAIPRLTHEGEDITFVLEQIEKVSMTLTDGLAQTARFTLTVEDKVRYEEFFYYRVTPVEVSPLDLENGDNTPFTITEVSFFPFILNQIFLNSEYNVLINSIGNQRKAKNLQVSERGKVSLLPSNIALIIQDEAQLADIPESNYTQVGWISARYIGSSTGDFNYGGIPSALGGRVFEGSVHPTTVDTGSICALPPTDRVIQTFVHTGESDFPTFETGSRFRVEVTQDLFEFDLQFTGSLAASPVPLQKHDLLYISGSTSNQMELVRVVDYNRQERRIEVQRGVLGTTPRNFPAGTFEIFPVKRNQIFRIDGNKPVTITDAQVWVRDPLTVVQVDKYGIVYSQGTCPEIIYFRPLE